jgi:micrococcal nuclease
MRIGYAILLAFGSAAAAPRLPAQGTPVPGEACIVERIVDGDTFYCRDGLKVRMTGIDSPEHGQGTPFSAARGGLLALMPVGHRVILERDVELSDRYGRRLAYVWDGNVLINERMVRGGWAVAYTVPPNVKYAERFLAAEAVARKGQAGLWASDGFACPPHDYRAGECGKQSGNQ